MPTHICCYLRLRRRDRFKAIAEIAEIAAINEITVIAATHDRTVTASLVLVTFKSLNSGCNSVARCTAFATLDSMDVKL